MAESPAATSETSSSRWSFLFRYVDPLDLLVEAIYTVLIVMTFTLAVKVFDEQNALGRLLAERFLSGLFLATLGCAVAWGLIDGVMYIFTSLAERSQQNRMIRTIRSAPTREEGARLAGSHLEESLPFPLDDEARVAFERIIYQEVAYAEPTQVRVKSDDIVGAIFVLLAALVVALPVVLPLLLVSQSAFWAVRLSNLVAFILLFYFGYRWARYTGGVPWTTGVLLLTVGVIMVMIAIPLGG